MNDPGFPTLEDIQEAARRIAPHAHRTPVLTSRFFNELAGGEVFFKCENFQRVGAFKFRGACNTVMSLSTEAVRTGVATHSSGNHAQALALAARLRGVPAYIVMPSTAPAVKRAAVEGYGARIRLCEPNLKARESTLEDVVEETGAAFVHPYNDWRIIAGQATAAMELIGESPDLDLLMTPVGGGGLVSGSALAAHYLSQGTQTIAVEPAGADDAFRSLGAGRIIPSTTPKTIADGLLTSLGDKTFAVIRRHVSNIVTVSDEAIVEAMRLVWERMKIVIEPSAAVVPAVLLEQKIDSRNRRIGIILSGGNVDLGSLPWASSNRSSAQS